MDHFSNPDVVWNRHFRPRGKLKKILTKGPFGTASRAASQLQ
jgi:hypothetical protein